MLGFSGTPQEDKGIQRMQQIPSAKTNSQIIEQEDVIEVFTLGPEQDAKVPLGMFETDVPQPVFEIECQPKVDADEGVVAALERIEKDDEYWLVYFIQNFTSNTYRITVKEGATTI
jgi:hypothetical protein